jgi:hypothetical protein
MRYISSTSEGFCLNVYSGLVLREIKQIAHSPILPRLAKSTITVSIALNIYGTTGFGNGNLLLFLCWI